MMGVFCGDGEFAICSDDATGSLPACRAASFVREWDALLRHVSSTPSVGIAAMRSEFKRNGRRSQAPYRGTAWECCSKDEALDFGSLEMRKCWHLGAQSGNNFPMCEGDEQKDADAGSRLLESQWNLGLLERSKVLSKVFAQSIHSDL